MYLENYVGCFSALYSIFAFSFISLKFIENNGIPEGGLELV